MTRRQTKPQQWLIADSRLGEELCPITRRLPPGSGVLVLYHDLAKRDRQVIIRRLRRLSRRLVIVDEAKGDAARVHNIRELRQALVKRTPMVLLSPMFPTRSHPDWRPIAPMRAAALARLARRNLIALGGMNQRRFRRVQRLGFTAWAGIEAWSKFTKVTRCVAIFRDSKRTPRALRT